MSKNKIIAFTAIIAIAVVSFCICFSVMQNALKFFENINPPHNLCDATLEFMSNIFNMTIILLLIAFIIALIALALECMIT